MGSARTPRGRRRAYRFTLLITLTALSTGGCRDIASALGDSPAEARTNADQLLISLGARFGPVQFAPGYEDERSKLSGSALVPSRLFGDTALWSASSGDIRDLVLSGRPVAGGYLLGEPGGREAPATPGEYRRSTRLRGLGEGQFDWTVRDELAVGTISSDDIAAALKRLFEGAEHSDAGAIRAAYQSSLPRTTRVLGRLFVLDSIASTPVDAGGTLLVASFESQPQRIAPEFPDLSRFLRKYGGPLKIEVAAEDSSGTIWWTADVNRDRTTVRLRVHEGRLAPLEGPIRTMPDRIRVLASASTRIRIFDIGASDIIADVSLRRDSGQAGFTASIREEPDWHFPPLVERIIRSSLRRPFAGDGVVIDLGARRTSGRTTLVREYRISVQESAILRWLGTLGSSTYDDFREGAEQEYDRFVGELYAALRQDVTVLLR